MYGLAKFAIVLTAVALSCWPAQAGPTVVPYKDLVTGTVVTARTGNPYVFYQILSGKGGGTLGSFTMSGTEFLNLNPKNLQVGTVTGGTFTNTLTDGSTVSGTFTGTFGPNPQIPGGRRLILQVAVQGGTGQLTGVSGKATTIVLTDGKVGFTYTSVGFLTFP